MPLLDLLDPFPARKAALPAAAQLPERRDQSIALTEARRSWDSLLGANSIYQRVPQEQNLLLYEQLVTLLPVINGGIRQLVRLTGCPRVMTDEPAKTILDEWMMNVRVNSIQTGFNPWFSSWVTDMLTYGRAHAEVILPRDRRTVYAIQELHTRTIELKPREGYGVDLVQVYPQIIGPRLLPRDVIFTAVYDTRNDSPQGCSILYGLPFVAQILETCFRSMGSTWERFGSPMYHVRWVPPEALSDPTSAQSQSYISSLMSTFGQMIASRREGKARDVGTAGDVEIRVVGAAGETLDFMIPYRTIAEQVCAAFGLPPMLLGLQFQTGERMGAVQASLVGEGVVKQIRQAVEPELLALLTLVLLLQGRRPPSGGLKLEWDAPTLIDAGEQAAAEKTQAEADEKRLSYDNALQRQGILADWEVAVRHREDLEGKTEAEVRAALPDLAAAPPPMMPAFGGGNGEERPGPRGIGNGLNPVSRSLTYGDDGFTKNGRH